MGGEAPATPTEMSEVGRLGGIFFAPTETCQSLARRPTFLVPLVLLTVLSLGVTWWIGYRVGWETVLRAQFEQSPRMREMPVEQREQAVQQALRTVPIFAYGAGLLGMVILALVVSGAMLFIFNVLVGSELDFRRVLSVVSWSMMPYAIASVLGFVIVGLKQPEDVDVQNLVASNLGALFDPDRTAKPLLSFLRSLDVFAAWQLFLLSTGLVAVARKLTFQKALTWLLLSWAVWVGVKVVWAVIFS